jgi:hypothetical protein
MWSWWVEGGCIALLPLLDDMRGSEGCGRTRSEKCTGDESASNSGDLFEIARRMPSRL